jgi:hypothetical protein
MMAEFTGFALNWKGDALEAKIRDASRWGIDSVMADCVTTAKSLVPVKTSILQGSIQMRSAIDEGARISGYWGSFATIYARWVEEGTGPHVILPKTKKALFWPGAAHPVRMVFHPGTRPHPYLMPAAEMHYPSLGIRIRAKAEWGAEA